MFAQKGLTRFCGMSEYMHLYLNSLQSTIPTELGRLTELTEIDLGANVLTGRIPTQFGRMQALQSIGLYVNQLTGRIPSQLATIPRLSVLYFDTNSLGPSLPDEICASLTFDEFWTDCSDIGGCDCCTRWYVLVAHGYLCQSVLIELLKSHSTLLPKPVLSLLLYSCEEGQACS